jgi:hypothetical protein
MTIPPPVQPPDDRVYPMRCLDCAYVLDGLDSPRCPECGREFDRNNPATYSFYPPLVRWKLWLPGVLTGLIGGFIVFALLEALFGFRGLGLWFGVPFAISAIACYRTRYAGLAIFLVICALCLIGTMLGLVIFGVAGIFCLFVLAGVLGLPVFVGGSIGFLVRVIIKDSRFSQRHYLPVLALLLVPVAIASIEAGLGYRHAVERVTTSGVIVAPLDETWNAMQFYEEVTHDPPWILRVGLARPLHTIGESCEVGDEKTCVYNKGRLIKRVTNVEPYVRLEFLIIEQRIGYERDVKLRSGSFTFEPVDERHTRITLVTEYEPLNAPRPLWRWGERYAVGLLHRHVIEGMKREAEHDTRLK